MEDRTYPTRPMLSASLAVWRGDDVLIAQRGKAPLRGIWSLPGGVVELGETAAQAARREVLEETAIEAEVVGLVDIVDVIHHDDAGDVYVHFVIAVFAGRYLSGTASAADDAMDAKWIRTSDLDAFTFTDRTPALIQRSRQLVET